MKYLKTFESWGMSKEEMIENLVSWGYKEEELMGKSEEELHSMCQEADRDPVEESWSISEKKGDKWIADAIKRPGALRKKMGKKEGEKISKAEIDTELAKLHKKDKYPDKKGDQLSKKDAQKKKQLTLAKTLKGMK